MTKQLLMGNEAMGLAALAAGVNIVCGYPGTPSTEVLETVAKHNPGDVHVEWSTNEKAAMELAAGASMAGARTMVTCKQVGLNVASDPLMTLSYLGVKGGMVIIVADDPGPISSQTEQDTRTFGEFSRVPVFDPSSPEEAYDMVKDAFELSEKHATPVIVRPTTRVSHACAAFEPEPRAAHEISGFEKKPDWVIFPRQSYLSHIRKDEDLRTIADEFCDYVYNATFDVSCNLDDDVEETEYYHADALDSLARGIVTGGISDAYTLEALATLDVDYRLLHVATPYPFPDTLAADFLEGLDEVLVLEELDPYLERQLLRVAGARSLSVTVRGKLTGDTSVAGENTTESVRADIRRFFGLPAGDKGLSTAKTTDAEASPALPMRPPVLCAGCPHRGSFYAVKRALRGREAVFSGDIGCYTLGNAAPLDMVDTCLCMGAGITQAQGLHLAEPDKVNIAFIGDSTFFASGITGVINAFYNDIDITVVVLDNSTTAMTGHQPHPGTGRTMMGTTTEKVSMDAVLRGIGLTVVEHANPLDLKSSMAAVKRAVEFHGVSAVIMEAPCIALFKAEAAPRITDACTNCQTCIRQLGCPALVLSDGQVAIDRDLCYGCNLCAQVCPSDAIETAAADTSDTADSKGSSVPAPAVPKDGDAR